MKRKITAFLLALLCVFQIPLSACAHDKKEHNRHMEYVLFGHENYSANQESTQRNAILALENAAYLCLDQFNGNGEEELRFLQDYGVPNLPTLWEIDFQGNYAHRMYTHKGWNPTSSPDKGNWTKRKEILVSTVKKVFGFGAEDEQKADAFAALLYYVHLLGDIDALETYASFAKEGSYIVPLARHEASKTNPDILYELTDVYLPQLFSEDVQSGSDYKMLQNMLMNIAVKARKLVSLQGGIDSEERYALYRDYALQVLDTLAQYVPKLLHQESFFVSIIPEYY